MNTSANPSWQAAFGLLEEGAHEKSPKCLDGNLGDFGEFWGILQRSQNKELKKVV